MSAILSYVTALPRALYFVGGFALMLFATHFIGETPVGWTVALIGVAAFLYGSRGFCPACAISGCRAPSRDDEQSK
jgi:hypothetical protein